MIKLQMKTMKTVVTMRCYDCRQITFAVKNLCYDCTLVSNTAELLKRATDSTTYPLDCALCSRDERATDLPCLFCRNKFESNKCNDEDGYFHLKEEDEERARVEHEDKFLNH